MFCTKCGAENPDGNGFCGKCGSPLTQSVQPQQAYVQQPQQYQQPYGQQAYAAPAYPQQAVPKKKSRAVPIVIVTVVLLALAAVSVWFFVIRPNFGVDERLRHVWERRNNGQLIEIYDFKDNYITEKNNPSVPISWSVGANDKLTIRLDKKLTFYYSISDDGQTLTLYFDKAKTDGLAYQRTD